MCGYQVPNLCYLEVVIGCEYKSEHGELAVGSRQLAVSSQEIIILLLTADWRLLTIY
jgi:hypothetical protein